MMGAPKALTLRPLNKGMVSALPDSQIPDGAFRYLSGVVVDEDGIVRRPGWRPLGNRTAAQMPHLEAGESIEDIIYYWTSGGQRKQIVLTNRRLFEDAGGAGYYPVRWAGSGTALLAATAYNTGTGVISITGDVTTGIEHLDLAIGDWVLFTNATLGSGVYAWAPITAFDETGVACSITIDPTVGGTSSTGAAWVGSGAGGNPYSATGGLYVAKRFLPVDPFPVSWVMFRDKVWITDGTDLQVMAYNGTALIKSPIMTSESADAVTAFTSCKVIGAHGDRLWFGYVVDYCTNETGPVRTNATQRNRLVFSSVLDSNTLILGNTYAATSYYDLYQTAGAIIAFGIVDQLLLVFTEDMVYYGARTNIPGAPVLFTKLSTGEMSMVGPRAWTPFLNGIVFVTHDDLLFVGADGNCQQFECPIRRELLDLNRIGAPLRIRMGFHAPLSALLIAVPWDGTTIIRIGCFNTRSKAWSLFQDNCAMTAISVGKGSSPMRWSDFGLDAHITGWHCTSSSVGGGLVTMVVTDDPTGLVAIGDWVYFTNATLGAGVTARAQITAVDTTAPYGLTINSTGEISSGGVWTYADPGNLPHDSATHFDVHTDSTVWRDTPGTWLDYASDYTERDIIYASPLGYLFYLRGTDADTNILGTAVPIGVRIETGDMDFGADNLDKTLLKVSARVNDQLVAPVRANDITYTITTSTDRGRNFRPYGTFTIEPGQDEDECHAKTSGPNIRVRLTSDALVDPFLLEELALRVRGRGEEEHRDH